MAGAAPSGFTEAGLPQRTPREKLVPGSVNGSGNTVDATLGGTAAEPKLSARDAEALRARLGSFQKGLARGRGKHELAAPDKGEQAKPSPGPRTGPDWPTDGTDDTAVSGPANWKFATDKGFEAAETLTGAAPGTFTQAGLPLRNPRERLVPGSAGAGRARTSRPPSGRARTRRSCAVGSATSSAG